MSSLNFGPLLPPHASSGDCGTTPTPMRLDSAYFHPIQLRPSTSFLLLDKSIREPWQPTSPTVNHLYPKTSTSGYPHVPTTGDKKSSSLCFACNEPRHSIFKCQKFVARSVDHQARFVKQQKSVFPLFWSRKPQLCMHFEVQMCDRRLQWESPHSSAWCPKGLCPSRTNNRCKTKT